jgi:hypothetical protein
LCDVARGGAMSGHDADVQGASDAADQDGLRLPNYANFEQCLRRWRRAIDVVEDWMNREDVRFLSLTKRRRLNPWRPLWR